MNVELKIKVSTMKELESILEVENLFCYMEIFPACIYDIENKLRSIHINGEINKDKITITENQIKFNIDPKTNYYDILLSIESQLKGVNKIEFNTEYIFVDNVRIWHLNKTAGPIEISYS